jgi:hypothetical protein
MFENTPAGVTDRTGALGSGVLPEINLPPLGFGPLPPLVG